MLLTTHYAQNYAGIIGEYLLKWPDPRLHMGIITCSASDNSPASGNVRLGKSLDHAGALLCVYCKR